MRLTTRSSYGIRALVALVQDQGDTRPVSIRDLAEKELISTVYLEQIFNKLKKNGVVKSVRGPKGGYMLARDPEEVTMLDVVKAVEPPDRGEKCLCGEENCEKGSFCASRKVRDEVFSRTVEVLSGLDLKSLSIEQKNPVA
jgi:Rrf2 family iron-sulfur cluster assembly transcriptional regulator